MAKAPGFDPFRYLPDSSAVRLTQQHYLSFAAQAGPRRVLDIGSGRGEFLDLAREAGFETVGIERDAVAARACSDRGHQVIHDELPSAVEQASGSFALVLMSHIIEHLEPSAAELVLCKVSARLSPGGSLVVVTPNTLNLAVGTHLFWLDPTHVRPYPDRLLADMLERAGLEVIHLADDPMSKPRDLRRWLPSRGLLRGLAAGVSMVAVGRRTHGPVETRAP